MLVDDPVKRVDNMTMAHGLEARVPFLDHELVELAAACPAELKTAQDRFANLEVSYILQRMETFDGVDALVAQMTDDVAAARAILSS